MKTILAIILATIMTTANVRADCYNQAIQVRILTDDGRTLPTYPVKIRKDISKVYMEAVKGDHYRIQVRNRLNRRVGLVIAVDGRNIISGGRSWLKSSERMYILEPYAWGEFAGWRTTGETISRFYFTQAPDSYAAAFGDGSAMGVISVAAYPERVTSPEPAPLTQSSPSFNQSHDNRGRGMDKPEAAAPSPSGSSKAKKAARPAPSMESAGTGYGRNEYSPADTVTFEPQKRAVHIAHIKYEWRATLCRAGVITCSRHPSLSRNRLWDNDGYAPPPPGRNQP